MNPTETAMQTYHARYNNTTYQAAQAAIIADLYGKHMVTQTHLIDRHAAYEPAHGLLNIMTDAALELCGHPDMVGRMNTLTRLILTHKLSADTITTIAAHLANFYKPTAEDWQHRALALHTLQAIDLHPAIQQTSELRGMNGNAAHSLIVAAENLLMVARLILQREPSTSYKREKLATAERHLGYAKDWVNDTR